MSSTRAFASVFGLLFGMVSSPFRLSAGSMQNTYVPTISRSGWRRAFCAPAPARQGGPGKEKQHRLVQAIRSPALCTRCFFDTIRHFHIKRKHYNKSVPSGPLSALTRKYLVCMEQQCHCANQPGKHQDATERMKHDQNVAKGPGIYLCLGMKGARRRRYPTIEYSMIV